MLKGRYIIWQSIHYQVLQSSSLRSVFFSSYPVDLAGSPYLCVGSPAPGAGSPAGSAAACVRLASDFLVEGTTPPGSG